MNADDEGLALILEARLEALELDLAALSLMAYGLAARCDEHHDVPAVMVATDSARRLRIVAASVQAWRESLAQLRYRDDADEDTRPTGRLLTRQTQHHRAETAELDLTPIPRPIGLPRAAGGSR